MENRPQLGLDRPSGEPHARPVHEVDLGGSGKGEKPGGWQREEGRSAPTSHQVAQEPEATARATQSLEIRPQIFRSVRPMESEFPSGIGLRTITQSEGVPTRDRGRPLGTSGFK